MSDELCGKSMDATTGLSEAQTQKVVSSFFQEQHAASLNRLVDSSLVTVAHVTVDSAETLTVKAENIGYAIAALAGSPAAGKRVYVSIVYAEMPLSEFNLIADDQ